MEESTGTFDGEITGIKFALATHSEVNKSSINECPIGHSSQLGNPFLGLPLETGKCESCGTAEPQKCEGHFGYIELPIPIYHPSHVVELRRMLSLLCLKCLKFKNNKFSTKSSGVLEKLLSSCCEETSHITVKDSTTADGASFIQLKLPGGRSKVPDSAWMFLEKYGYSYGGGPSRTLLPSEVLAILKKLPEETKKKLIKKGYFPQEGYILRFLPVPPNCLSVPDISDGISVVSMDLASTMLKKVLRQIELIKSTRSGEPNFESHEVEANELQVAVLQYLQVRGAGTASNEVRKHYGVSKEVNKTATKAWLDKMRTLFISKGSGFSSRSVITGETYKKVDEIGLPSEIAQRITFEEKVNVHNINFLQSLVDNNLCLSYGDGMSSYSLREGSKGHTFLRPGQVVHRRIMDGDVVFINRPPTTHKHSLQALRVYVHEDHTVKINPLMCGPLAADFDGDCVHLFYPQSLSARAEVLELFSVEKQLLSSHTGNLNLQLATDALLSLKMLFKTYFLGKSSAQQLNMFASNPLPPPALQKGHVSVPCWTALQVIQSTLPTQFDCYGDCHMIRKSEILKIDRDVMQSMLNEIVTSMVFDKGPKEALGFFDSLQPLLMENLFSEGFSVGLEDFNIPSTLLGDIQRQLQDISSLLFQLRTSYNELIERQMESYLRRLKKPVAQFVLTSSALGSLIDSKSESAINKIAQQIGFLGLQLYDRGKFYSKDLVDDMAHLFHQKYPFRGEFPCEEYGLVKSAFFHGLDPYEEIAHSIASREVIIRSSRGLAEPGTLFKNLMAILRDVVICYDGTVRNVSSNSVIQFDYGVQGEKSQSLFPAGEPVGVLAATAMSNPAYKAVLDSSPSSNSSWDMMKEILFCNVNFKNDMMDRRVVLYLNYCECGRKFCRENASCRVKNLLKKVSLRDAAVEFLIEYKSPAVTSENYELDTGLVGHIHLSKALLNDSNISMHDILEKCQDEVSSFRKKKHFGRHFKMILLSVSECCPFSHGSKWSNMPCLKFFWQDMGDDHLDNTSHVMADIICPVLLDTVVKGDPRIAAVNIIWINPDTSTWIGSSSDRQLGELAVEVVLERKAVKRSGDAWRVVLDCCLPVFHLIDTRRSIPYAVKQIQDLLGISCAFDQAVQRLSTSVTMVAKGVLKEHLILLASSMTSTGTLIGFNSSGIKAMCRTLGVQVPFTEATLYTPRKCFERAAEKCHLDSLSSIVASCSWGKHVAVGTGARFDIIWNEKEAPLQKGVIDVYDFLQLVRSSHGEEDDIGCLGDDVDKFEMEDEYMEDVQSPKDSKAVFEDTELELDKNDGWENSAWNSGVNKQATDLAWNSQSHGQSTDGWNSQSKGWDSKKNKPNTSVAWSSAEDLSAPVSSEGWGSANERSKSMVGSNADEGGSGWNQSGGWESKKDTLQTSSAWGPLKELSAPASSQSWGSASEGTANATDKSASGWKSGGWDSKKNNQETSDAWGFSKKTSIPVSDEVDKFKLKNTADESASAWNSQSVGWQVKKNKADNSSNWGSSNEFKKNKAENSSNWGSLNEFKKDKADNSSNWGSSKESPTTAGSQGWGSANEGNKSSLEHTAYEGPSTWSPANKSHGQSSWGSRNVASSDGEEGSSWRQPSNSATKKADDWGSSNKSVQPSDSQGWDAKFPATEAKASTMWGQPSRSASLETIKQSDKPANSQGWNSGKEGNRIEGDTECLWEKPSPSASRKTDDAGGFDWACSNKSDDSPSSKAWHLKEVPAGEKETESQSGQPGGWSSSDQWQEPATLHGWDALKNGSESEAQSPWGQTGGSTWKKKGPNTSWGSSDTGDWKNKRNRPARPPRSSDGSKNTLFTATRQRLDLFTPEEQEILSEVEPIMQSIRRIMHQEGYTDGDPIPTEDQSYILDNVLAYHPDKDAKLGGGMDHMMVSKHSSFQDSRCLYVVATDGQKQDFSYRKCLENLVKKKHPDLAESFISKYWRRPRNVAGREQEQSEKDA